MNTDEINQKFAELMSSGKFKNTGAMYTPEQARADASNPDLRLTASITEGKGLVWSKDDKPTGAPKLNWWKTLQALSKVKFQDNQFASQIKQALADRREPDGDNFSQNVRATAWKLIELGKIEADDLKVSE